MAGMVDARLADFGIQLPDAPVPAGNYVPYVITGNLIFVAGQIPASKGEVKFIGKVGADLSVDDGIAAARLCVLNIIAQARIALDGDLDRIVRFVKVGGFVNSVEDFTDHPKVINGASDLLVEIFGESGRHARFAVGSSSLPLGIGVEIDAVIEFA
jgi:enamine deaminase RidA (YjgF/YER057c/UK114 family)